MTKSRITREWPRFKKEIKEEGQKSLRTKDKGESREVRFQMGERKISGTRRTVWKEMGKRKI